MNAPASSSVPLSAPAAGVAASLHWADPVRQAAFAQWLSAVGPRHGLRPETVRLASADASFRRYFRVDTEADGPRIAMDAPPDKENSEPFVRIAGLMAEAGVPVPKVLDWDAAHGFMLLTDMGERTLLDEVQSAAASAAPGADAMAPCHHAFGDALDSLVAWQSSTRAGVLPPYDEALMRRELQLFPDWYLAQHKGLALTEAQQRTLSQAFDAIVSRCLNAPMVYVHRDFMPRNLMVPRAGLAAVSNGDPVQRLGVLDFQDAVWGPVTYDIASLMRDAFWSWDEAQVIDITVRYWERARRAGLLDHEDWSQDFGAFYRAVEWMGLQRHLKVAGIFARLTLRDGKPKYLADAPRFIGYIRHTAARYRELTPLLRLIDEVEGLQAATGYAFGRV